MIFRKIFYVLIISSVVFCEEALKTNTPLTDAPPRESTTLVMENLTTSTPLASLTSGVDQTSESFTTVTTVETSLSTLENKLKDVFNETNELNVTEECAKRVLEKCPLLKSSTNCSEHIVLAIKECLKDWDMEAKENSVCKDTDGSNKGFSSLTNYIHCGAVFLRTDFIGDAHEGATNFMPQFMVVFLLSCLLF